MCIYYFYVTPCVWRDVCVAFTLPSFPSLLPLFEPQVPYFMFFVDGALVSHHSGANPRLLKQTLLELSQGFM